jgi:uracil-DNA glycosylase family 4
MIHQSFFDFGVSNVPKKPKKKYKDCDDCGFYKTCKTPKMDIRGGGEKRILILGGIPTHRDDRRDRYFSEKYNGVLIDALEDNGIDIEKDCFMLNAVRCYGAEKVDKAVEICRGKLHKTIKEIKPTLIIALGDMAIDGLIGDKIKGRLSGTPKKSFYGHIIPDQNFKCWIAPTYSPLELEEMWDRERADHLRIFKEHIEDALLRKNITLPQPYTKVKWTTEEGEAIEWIRGILALRKAVVAYDYETTGIKPHKDGHELVTASIACDGVGYAFPFFDSDRFRSIWNRLLTAENIETVAHNMGFEFMWTKVRAGMDQFPTNYGWDTCLAAHCLDNQAPTSLKFQTYTNLGILGFDDAVDEFITKPAPGQDKKSGNSFNKIHDCALSVLLKYNAYDSLYTLQLYEIQARAISTRQLEGLNLFLRSTATLSEASNNGMNIDVKQMEKNFDELDQLLTNLLKEFHVLVEQTGFDGKVEIDSQPQLVKFIYGFLEIPVGRDGSKVDEKALSKMEHPCAQKILEYRKIKKLKDTYLAQFKREMCDGKIHTSFSLNRVVSFRTSSQSPNYQNTPIRDPRGNKYIRGIIVPDPGCMITEYDYKALEVSIGTCYHKDPNMIEYLNSEDADFHTDTCCDLFMRDLETFNKVERHITKNKFVFPSFYGSSAKPQKDQKVGVTARDLWESAPGATIQHLMDNGVRTIEDFQAHVLEVERILWEERFPVYNEWRNKTWKQYLRKGYLDQFTGFRLYGPLSFTQAINMQTQGSATHVLLYTMNGASEELKNMSGKSYFTGQIHDSIVGNVHPDDVEGLDAAVKYYGTQRVVERYPELEIVPLVIEKDVAPIDAPWSMKEEIGKI